MTLTKADIAQKIANDCGFMKNEAAEIMDKLLDIMKSRLIAERMS
jgi:nucleoid DNA-binding protein